MNDLTGPVNLDLAKAILEERIKFANIVWANVGSAIKSVNEAFLDLKRAEEKEKKKLEDIGNMMSIQCQNGTWNANLYMFGMANGLIAAYSHLMNVDPVFLDKPDVWLDDLPKSNDPPSFVKEGNEETDREKVLEVMKEESDLGTLRLIDDMTNPDNTHFCTFEMKRCDGWVQGELWGYEVTMGIPFTAGVNDIKIWDKSVKAVIRRAYEQVWPMLIAKMDLLKERMDKENGQ